MVVRAASPRDTEHELVHVDDFTRVVLGNEHGVERRVLAMRQTGSVVSLVVGIGFL